MTVAEAKHEQAMELVDNALAARRVGKDDEALALFKEAFAAERDAAMQLQNELKLEPSRGILFRSAASLAIDCGETREAERLAAEGLRGNPPPLVESELREVLDRANFDRHMSTRGIKLAPVEFQFTVAGPAIAPGLAPAPAIVGRLLTLQRALKRTAQRKRHEPFQEHPGKSDADFELFLEAPRAASFAVTIRVGAPQLLLPGQLDDRVAVVDEFIDCVELAQAQDESPLRARFEQTAGDSAEAYFVNFKAAVEQLRPDGDGVSLVGLTRQRSGVEQRFDIRPRQRPDRPRGTKRPEEKSPRPEDQREEVRGVLLYADSTGAKPEIRVRRQDGSDVKFHVPEGLMADVVRPYFDETVVVSGRKKGGVLILEECRLAE